MPCLRPFLFTHESAPVYEFLLPADSMSRSSAILLLLLAAALEAGGDAILRIGLHTSAISQRVMLFLLAAIVLFAYGWTVNASPWDFGRLL